MKGTLFTDIFCLSLSGLRIFYLHLCTNIRLTTYDTSQYIIAVSAIDNWRQKNIPKRTATYEQRSVQLLYWS